MSKIQKVFTMFVGLASVAVVVNCASMSNKKATALAYDYEDISAAAKPVRATKRAPAQLKQDYTLRAKNAADSNSHDPLDYKGLAFLGNSAAEVSFPSMPSSKDEIVGRPSTPYERALKANPDYFTNSQKLTLKKWILIKRASNVCKYLKEGAPTFIHAKTVPTVPIALIAIDDSGLAITETQESFETPDYPEYYAGSFHPKNITHLPKYIEKLECTKK